MVLELGHITENMVHNQHCVQNQVWSLHQQSHFQDLSSKILTQKFKERFKSEFETWPINLNNEVIRRKNMFVMFLYIVENLGI